MKKENIILVGGGGHAKACLDIILSTNQYKILGYIDQNELLDTKFGVTYLGKDEVISNYTGLSKFLITIGQIKSPETRISMFQKLKTAGAKLATVISPYAIISNFSTIGEGTIVMHGVILQSNSTIGINCIINDNVLIEHDVIVGDHCHISTSATLNGDVKIGKKTFIGSNSIISNQIVIGNEVIVGAGSVVIKNINDFKKVYGNPAK